MRKFIGLFLFLFVSALLGLFLFLFVSAPLGDQIDVTKSRGTDQSIITSLTPSPASPEVDANITIEAIFHEELNPMSTLHSVTLKRLNNKKSIWETFGFGIFKNSNETISGSIEYDHNKNILRFTPEQPLKVGFYELAFRHLMKKMPGIDMHIKPIVYRFYVPEVINGFKLPPEPDEDKNNATLLGIDFNHNGIRDDVERFIIIEEAKNDEFPKTQTVISLQYAYAWQKIIEDPILETRKYLENASACQNYFIDKHTKGMTFREYLNWEKSHPGMLGVKLEDKIFNTKERILRRFEFNRACSGHIFSLKKAGLGACMVNIDELGE